MRNPLPAVAVAVGFIDRINRTDVDGLAALMADGHSLHVFGEPPLAANVEAWRGYTWTLLEDTGAQREEHGLTEQGAGTAGRR